MLVMVTERFKDVAAVRERFLAQGRMLPDGVAFVDSWISPDGITCWMLVTTPSIPALQPWIDRWTDLMEFSVEEALPSRDFWAEFDQRAL